MQPPALGQPVPASNSEAQVTVPTRHFFFLLLPLSHIFQLSYPPKVDTIFHQPQLCFLSQFVQHPRGETCCFTGPLEMKVESLPLGSRQQGHNTKKPPKPELCSKASLVSLRPLLGISLLNAPDPQPVNRQGAQRMWLLR